jgi:2-oxo-3-hexenedioate decarboxylase
MLTLVPAKLRRAEYTAVMPIDPGAVAQELIDAYEAGDLLPQTLSSREGFDLRTAYAVEAELARRRRAQGRTVVGRKVAFANPAVWPKLNLQTVAWGSMYDDTVHPASDIDLIPVPFTYAPKLEPEVVFKLKGPLAGDPADVVAVLNAVEWIALGYEIVDCPFPEWQFQPADLVAAFGFHTGLVVGPPTIVTPATAPVLAKQLATFKLKLFKNDTFIEEGGGRNVLGNPALCVRELAAAIARSPGATPLGAGELVSTGALTTPMLIAPGETWRAEAEGLDVAPVVMKL